MRYSLNWLQEYTPWKDEIKVADLISELNTKVAEVDKVINWSEIWSNIVIGLVEDIQPHPDAKKLRLITVNLGSLGSRTLVCGGTNLEFGQPVVVALPGAVIYWHGDSAPTVLQTTSIRGIDSAGMICAAEEFMWTEIFPEQASKNPGEIVDLRQVHPSFNQAYWQSQAGMNLSAVITQDDIILEIENKTINHRADLWGQYGLAREIAAMYNLPLKPLNVEALTKLPAGLKVKIETETGPYLATTINSVTASKSSWNIAQKLRLLGERPINSIVDSANYTMFEVGQPLHTFDADQLNSGLKVRAGNIGEKSELLDGNQVEISSREDIIITDDNGILALAGIKGSKRGSVTTETKNIILEAANFPATTIRRSSQRYGLRTNASSRYEKTLDPTLIDLATRRFVAILKTEIPNAQVTGQTLVGDLAAANPKRIINLNLTWLYQKIGQVIPAEHIKRYLLALGCELAEINDGWAVTIPSWRRMKDLTQPEDLVEEIVRLYGYEKIKPVFPVGLLNQSQPDQKLILLEKIRDYLVRDGKATEMQTYSFVSETQARAFGFDSTKCWQIRQPQNTGATLLRPSILPNLLSALVKDQAESSLAFEIGRIFISEANMELTAVQPYQVAVIYRQIKPNKVWPDSAAYRLKSLWLELSTALNLTATSLPNSSAPIWAHPKQYLAWGLPLAVEAEIATLHPALMADYGFPANSDIAALILNLNHLRFESINWTAQAPQQFPSLKRDLSILVPNSVTVAEGENLIHQTLQGDWSLTLNLFDVFELDGKKSLAWHLSFSKATATLQAQDIEMVWKNLEQALKEKNWELRG